MRSTGRRPHIVIAEDDAIVGSLLAAHLEALDCSVDVAASGRTLLAQIEQRHVDLVLLDLGLPDEDGLVLARQLRTRLPRLPIIVLTARASEDDRIAALEIGVDDYLLKDVGARELVLRVRNALARSWTDGSGDTTRPTQLAFDGWVLDFDARRLTDPRGDEIELTGGEFELLAALARTPNRVRSRGQLLDELSRGAEPPDERMVDAFISRIRAKMGTRAFVTTITGVGYRFDPKGKRKSGE